MFKKSNSNIERTLKVQEFYTKTQVLCKKLRLKPIIQKTSVDRYSPTVYPVNNSDYLRSNNTSKGKTV
jgi:hypothetical protein